MDVLNKHLAPLTRHVGVAACLCCGLAISNNGDHYEIEPMPEALNDNTVQPPEGGPEPH